MWNLSITVCFFSPLKKPKHMNNNKTKPYKTWKINIVFSTFETIHERGGERRINGTRNRTYVVYVLLKDCFSFSISCSSFSIFFSFFLVTYAWSTTTIASALSIMRMNVMKGVVRSTIFHLPKEGVLFRFKYMFFVCFVNKL